MNEKLRQARIDRRWTVDHAARRIGISRTTYLRWEQGTQVPHDSSLMLVCKAFNLSPEKLGFVQEALNTPIGENPIGIVIPEQTAEFWKPGSPDPTISSRLSVWSFLIQEESLVNSHEILYDKVIQEVLAVALQSKQLPGSIRATQQLVRKVIRKYDAMHNDHAHNGVKVTRRNALIALAQFPIQLYGLTLFTSNQRVLPSPEEMLPLCAAGLAACHELRQYEHEGMLAIRRILSAYLPTLEHFVQQSSLHQHTAANLTAQGYLLVSNVADHYGKLDQMESASCLARLYAQIAHDPNLEAAALNRLAIRFSFGNREAQALEVYQEAIAFPGFAHVSPLLQGRIYAGLASTSASCQQVAQALSALSRAKDIWPANPETDPSYAFAVNKTPRLALWEGLTLAGTGKYTEAANVFAQFGRLEPVPGLRESSRSEYLNYAASVAAKQRNLEAASTYLEAAEEIAWNSHNEQRLSETHTMLSKLQLLWPDEPKVKELQEKMYAHQR